MGIVLIFLYYGFLGWIIDSLYRSIVDRTWKRGGFSRFPLAPTYGLGAILLILIGPVILPLPFWLELIVLGLIFSTYEYLCGIFSLSVMKRRFWDYSKSFLNVHGQTDLLHGIYWALLSYTVLHKMHPWIITWIPEMRLEILT